MTGPDLAAMTTREAEQLRLAVRVTYLLSDGRRGDLVFAMRPQEIRRPMIQDNRVRLRAKRAIARRERVGHAQVRIESIDTY